MSATLLLTAEEATAQLRIARSRIFELMQDGTILSVKIGASRRIPYTALTLGFLRRLFRVIESLQKVIPADR
jgi:excisionase family DNA binding protein